MRKLKIVLVPLVVLAACSPFSLIPGSTSLRDGVMLTDTQEVVDKMRALCCEDGWQNHLVEAEYEYRKENGSGEEYDVGADFLELLEAAGERFDANEYFKVLTHLTLEDGYVLDYVYYAPRGFGAPYLYARRETEPAFVDFSAYQDTGYESYLGHIQVDDTAEGYYELVVLSVMGKQFYLSWHAAYEDWEVVGSSERLEEIVEWLNEEYHPLTEEQTEAALQLDVAPRVKLGRDKVLVRVLMFTKFGGFYERVYTIDRNFPHLMVEYEIELLPYNCGVIL